MGSQGPPLWPDDPRPEAAKPAANSQARAYLPGKLHQALERPAGQQWPARPRCWTACSRSPALPGLRRGVMRVPMAGLASAWRLRAGLLQTAWLQWLGLLPVPAYWEGESGIVITARGAFWAGCEALGVLRGEGCQVRRRELAQGWSRCVAVDLVGLQAAGQLAC